MLRKYVRGLLDLLFPPTCPGCGTVTVEQEGPVCTGCLLDISETGFHDAPTDNELYYRLAGKVPLDGAAALYYFDKKGKFQRIVQGLKYKNMPQVGNYLGKYYAQQLKATPLLSGIDMLVPVPLHPRRQRERGYNQAERIATGLSAVLDIPVRTDVLRRVRATGSQTRKGQAARWENVRDVFAVEQPASGGIMLVDDVITTGATLEACIRTLCADVTAPQKLTVLALGMARND